MEKRKKKNESSRPISAGEAILIHLICSLGLALAFFFPQNVYSIDLVSNPSHSLRLIWVIQCSIVVLLYSRYRHDKEQCSYFKAILRGLLGLPAGALLNAFGAIVLGAPVGTQYFWKTVNWSLMMSSFTIVPASSVFGSSWTDWLRLFAHLKPVGFIDHIICLPAHGAVIGAWFGAWPMPLDWERPWQEWPICVSYGAMIGSLTGMVASLGFQLVRCGLLHHKGD